MNRKGVRIGPEPLFVFARIMQLQRKVVSPNDFFDLGAITERLAGFEARYNAAARPFDWKFDRDDLDELLARIATHEQGAPLPLAAAA
jgi:hypothetical protein